jgi:hypothetical protein
MAYTSLKGFQHYTNVFTEGMAKVQQKYYLTSAEQIINAYLGYEPLLQNYQQFFNGTDTNILFLRAKPVRELISVVINDNEVPVEYFFYNDTSESLIYKYGTFPDGLLNIFVSYKAGYNIIVDDSIDGGHSDSAYYDYEYEAEQKYIDAGNASTVDMGNPDNEYFIDDKTLFPKLIIQTVFRIAALLQSEGDSNIGVTSKSFSDSGSRTFINFTNFDKYLLPIAKYKLTVI